MEKGRNGNQERERSLLFHDTVKERKEKPPINSIWKKPVGGRGGGLGAEPIKGEKWRSRN